MNKEIHPLKQAYYDIEIPKELAQAVQSGMERGRIQRKRMRTIKRWTTRIGVSSAVLFILLTLTVNTMPAFASSLKSIPGLGKLVQVLQFHNGSASGGSLQGAANIRHIQLEKEGAQESVILHFSEGSKPQKTASLFHVKISSYPSMMTFSMDARRFTAIDELKMLEQSQYIEDAYQIISMDDSLIRFNVVFNEAVKYEIKEYEEPAQVVITLQAMSTADLTQKPSMYSLRTVSAPYGESQGLFEEVLSGREGKRILKDEEGMFLVEAGLFHTRAEAEKSLQDIEEQLGMAKHFVIEERAFSQVPATIMASEN